MNCNNLVLKKQIHTTVFWWHLQTDSGVFHWSDEVQDSRYDKRRRFAVGKREQDQDGHLGCALFWQIWSQNPPDLWKLEHSELRTVFVAIRIISVLSLFNCSWLFIIHAFTWTELTEIQDWVEWIISGSWVMLPDLYSWLLSEKLWREIEW